MIIGIRIEITQVTDDMVHSLFQIYNTQNIDLDTIKLETFLEDLKKSSIILTKGKST